MKNYWLNKKRVVAEEFWVKRDSKLDASALVETRQPLLTEYAIGQKEYFMVHGDVKLSVLDDGSFQHPVTGEIWLDERLEV